MNMLSHIADRVLGRPLFIHQAKAALILSILSERIGVEAPATDDIDDVFKQFQSQRPAANRLIGEPAGVLDADGKDRGRWMYNLAGGVAIIPVVGSLINRGAFTGTSSGLKSYEGLAVQINAAVSDPRVGSILLDIDSPGGEATGMFAVAETIRAARQQKPVIALVDDMAASAAYGIASAATEIVASPTSIVGSIGVVMLHVDQSEEMRMKGRKATLIFAGAKKVDGNPLGPLSESIRADMQADVNTFYERFVEAVAAGRPMLSIDAIKATEADTYIGTQGKKMGLVDRIGTFNETLMRASAQAKSRLMFQQRGITMTQESTDLMTIAQHQTALATATAEARAAGHAEGVKAGATSAIERIRAILTAPEAKDRSAVALVFALDTDMPVEAAIKALTASPVTPVAEAQPKVPPIADRSPQPVGNGNSSVVPDASTFWGEIADKVNAEAKRQHAR